MAVDWPLQEEPRAARSLAPAGVAPIEDSWERGVFALVESAVRVRHRALLERFRRQVGAAPAIARPATYHEKLLWRKLFDHDPRFPVISDKLAVKDYVRERCPEVAIPRVAWAGKRAEEVPDAFLAGPWVIKTNHGWNQNHFSARAEVSREDFERRFRDFLAAPWGGFELESAYRDIPRRIFAEEMITGPDGGLVREELKVHVFDGVATIVSYIVGRYTEAEAGALFSRGGTQVEAYACDFRRLPTTSRPHPQALASAVGAAERLAADYDYLRCDFYVVGPEIFFSELTLYPDAGYLSFSSPHVLTLFGQAWDLRRSWFLTAPQPWPRSLYAGALRRRLDREARGGMGTV